MAIYNVFMEGNIRRYLDKNIDKELREKLGDCSFWTLSKEALDFLKDINGTEKLIKAIEQYGKVIVFRLSDKDL